MATLLETLLQEQSAATPGTIGPKPAAGVRKSSAAPKKGDVTVNGVDISPSRVGIGARMTDAARVGLIRLLGSEPANPDAVSELASRGFSQIGSAIDEAKGSVATFLGGVPRGGTSRPTPAVASPVRKVAIKPAVGASTDANSPSGVPSPSGAGARLSNVIRSGNTFTLADQTARPGDLATRAAELGVSVVGGVPQLTNADAQRAAQRAGGTPGGAGFDLNAANQEFAKANAIRAKTIKSLSPNQQVIAIDSNPFNRFDAIDAKNAPLGVRRAREAEAATLAAAQMKASADLASEQIKAQQADQASLRSTDVGILNAGVGAANARSLAAVRQQDAILASAINTLTAQLLLEKDAKKRESIQKDIEVLQGGRTGSPLDAAIAERFNQL